MHLDVGAYWGDVRRAYQPLTRAEEDALGKELLAARDVLAADPTSPDGERELLRIQERYILSALPLALSTAKKRACLTFPLADAVQVANLALLHAFSKFEPERGNRFITYASWWMRAYLGTARFEASTPVRLPRYLSSPATRADLDGARRAATHRVLAKPIELDAQHRDPTRSTDGMGPILPDELVDDRDIAGGVDTERLRARVRQVLHDCLDARSAMIVRRRIGMDTGDEETLAAIGDDCGLSRERVRQIERDAYAALREELADLAS